MKRIVVISCILLSACTTPETVMKNDKTGDVRTCGGHNQLSWLMGVPGYYQQKSQDAECVSNNLELGFKRAALPSN